jgi:hypothetical protein
MTTVLLIGMLIWIGGLEWRLWINIHRLNEHLEESPQQMNFLRASATATLPTRPQDAPNLARKRVLGNKIGSLASGVDSALTNA